MVTGLKAVSFVVNIPLHLVSKTLGGISEAIEKLVIDEKTWNPDAKGYFSIAETAIDAFFNAFKKPLIFIDAKLAWLANWFNKSKRIKALHLVGEIIEGFRKKLEVIPQVLDFLRTMVIDNWQFFVGLVCGIWNAIIDLITGILGFVKLLMDLQIAINDAQAQFLEGIGIYFNLFLEYIDNFWQAIKEIDLFEVVKALSDGWSSFVSGLAELPGKIWDYLADVNPAELGYFIGYLAANIAEFFIPVLKVAKLAKAGKFGKAFDEIAASMVKLETGAVKMAKGMGRGAINTILGFIDKSIEILRGGTAAIKEFIALFFKKLRQWLDERVAKAKTDVPEIRYHLIKEVPSVSKFVKWFDDLSVEEFDILWENPNLANIVKARLRHPGGLHEWLLVSRANTFKKWGVSASEIKLLRSKMQDVIFKNPPGYHGGPGSTKAHNEILKIIDESASYENFKMELIVWADKRLLGGSIKLPKGFRKK